MGHISVLFENDYITSEEKNIVFKNQIDNFPEDIKEWILKGLESHDIAELRQNLTKYSYLFS